MEEQLEKPLEDSEPSRKRSRDEEEEEEKQTETKEIAAKRPNNQSTVYFKVLVPSSSAGAIIGKGGETINQLQADTASNIKMSKGGDFFPGTTDRVCMVIGTVENVKRVHNFLLQKIKEKPDPNTIVNPNEVKTKVVVPNSTVSLIIGKNGDFIKHITDSTGAFLQVSPKSNDAEKPLSERIITVSGDASCCDKAIDLILEKIIEDPQSGTCINVSYVEGQNLPQNSYSSVISTNLVSSLHMPVTGHPAMETLKFVLRAKGYNEPATREITAAMYTLASYGFLTLRPTVLPSMNQEWPIQGASGEPVAGSEYYSQGTEIAGQAAATDASCQTQDMSNYSQYYSNYYGNTGNYGNGYNSGGNYDSNAAYSASGYGSYGNMGNVENMGGMQDMSGYSMGAQSYNQSVASGGYPAGGESYSMASGNYSMAGGGGGGGGYSGNYSSGGSAVTPVQQNSEPSTTQEVDVADNVLQMINGHEGKGISELQNWCGVGIEVTQKSPYLHTLRITGAQNPVQSALYVVHQYVQQAEYRRYYEGQAAGNQHGGHQ